MLDILRNAPAAGAARTSSFADTSAGYNFFFLQTVKNFAPVRQRTCSDSLLPFIKSSIPRSELVQSLPLLSSEIPSLKSALTRDVKGETKIVLEENR